MPPLVRNGPDLPVELLQAHERGRLVLFCGAGVSLGAGLPSFKGLVERVYSELGVERQYGETAAFRSGAFDRVFELLERRLDPLFVRRAVARVLRPSAGAALEAHSNLLRLSQGPEGRLRLITTNFDPLFAQAATAGGLELRIHRAPFVPVPRPSWSGLVHLHGALPNSDEEASLDPLSDLVLSSSDFGRAYLTEGWASRFLRELFREFDVLFVGYSINDPAVRYLMDALASQRRLGEAFHGAWVLAGVRGGKREAAERQRWSELAIQPLFYNQAHDHRVLYKSLEEWAYLHRGGLLTRAGWVARKYWIPPDSPREDDAMMVTWALADSTGTAARAWADADLGDGGAPTPDQSRNALQWLDLFEESDQLEHKGNESRLLSDVMPRATDLVSLVGRGHQTPDLPPATYHLARWIARYVEEEWFIGRLIARGGVIHPQFAQILREELGSRSISEPWKRRLLETLVSPAYQEAVTRSLARDLRSRLTLEEHPGVRMELTRILEPIPRFRATRGPRLHPPDDQPPQPPFEPELTLAGHHLEVRSAIDGFGGADGERRLASHALSISRLVEGAADWLTFLYPEESQSALAWKAIHSIADEGQERLGEAEWAGLLSLAAGSLAALLRIDLAAGESLVERWLRHGHVLFKRLALHAHTEHPQLNPARAAELLLAQDSAALWDLFLTRERERFFRKAASRIDAQSMSRLEAAILAGPPDEGEEARPAGEARRARERAVWRLLIKLKIGGASLSREALERLRRIEEEFDWATHPDFLDELLVFSVDIDEEPAVASLLAMDLQTLAESIGTGGRTSATTHWDDLVRRRPVRALSALRRCSRRELWPIEFWAEFLNFAPLNLKDQPFRLRLLTATWRLLEAAPEGTLAALLHGLTSLLRATARDIPKTCHDQALRSWDRLWPLAPYEPETILSPTDSFSQALNHPAGHLAGALLELLSSRDPEKGGGIAPDLRARLEALLATTRPEGAKYGHLPIVAHLPYLYFVDAQWATENVVPLFDWSQEIAPDAWNAFLHHPRFSPDLLDQLRGHLVEAVRRRTQLPDDARRALVELLGVLGVEVREWIPADLQRELLRSLESSELAELAWRLRYFAESDPGLASQRWREAIQPWFLRFWPKEVAKRSPEEAEPLAELVLETGEAFEEATRSIGPFLVPMHDSRVPYLLSSQRTEHLERSPDAVLDLLDRIVPQEPMDAEHWSFFGLDEVLAALESRSPGLAARPIFRRLREFLLRR